MIDTNRATRTLAEREIERRTLVHLAFGADPAAVPVNDPFDDRQPHAGAFKVLGMMQALEHAEQFSACSLSKPTPLSRHGR